MEAIITDGRTMVVTALQEKLDVLKQNRENVPLEQLKTRYKTAYNKLLAEVNDKFQAMTNRALRGIDVKEDSYEAINRIWQETYKKEVSHSIYKEYSAEKAQILIEDFINKIVCEFGY